MPEDSNVIIEDATASAVWGRDETAALLTRFLKQRRETGIGPSKFAESVGIAPTTLTYWLDRANKLDASPEAIAFFESPAGLVFLHSFVVAAHLVMTMMGGAGIRLVCLLIELSGLGPFIAASYGSQQKVSSEMQEAIVEFGEHQRRELGKDMPHKKITVCEDETFLSEGICLVAIEPVSNFILLEQYADNREAATWNAALKTATKDLNVEVVQSTSDEALALVRHAKDIGAHHGPDIFHVQNEVNRAMGLPLLRRLDKAKQDHADAAQATRRQQDAKAAYWSGPRSSGRPPDFDGRIRDARKVEEEAAARLETAKDHWRGWLAAVRGIGDAYHPYDLGTGRPRTADEVRRLLEEHFDAARRIAAEASLPARSLKRIEKAARVGPKMVATISFYTDAVDQRVDALSATGEEEELLKTTLIPAAYLRRVAERSEDLERRKEVLTAADRLLQPLTRPDNPASNLGQEARERLERAAFDCADVFQRASSCTEGRNGQLSQWEHAQRRLSPGKLAALTVVHSFYATRPDGTTAAERFFGTKPADLFEWLLWRMPLPARPAKRRVRPKKPTLFPSGGSHELTER